MFPFENQIVSGKKRKNLSFDFLAAGPDDAASCFGPSALGQKINRKDKDDGSNTVGFI